MLFGRGVCAEIEPLLMIRPPRGSWAFIIRTACWAHRKTPVRLVSTTRCQSARSISSAWAAGPNKPALFTSRSSRPQRSRTASKSAATDGGEVTSAGTTSAFSVGQPGPGVSVPSAAFAVSASNSSRRPASATCQPAPSRALAMVRPSPEPAPVTTATPMALNPFLACSGDDGDRPAARLDQPDRQRPDPAVAGLGRGAHDDGVGADLVGHPPQFGVRIAAGGDERDRHAQRPGALLHPSPQVRRCFGEDLVPGGEHARPGRRGAVKGRDRLDVDADQAGPLSPGQPGRVRPGPQRGDGIVDPDQDDLGPVGAQFEGSAFLVRHSGNYRYEIMRPNGPGDCPGPADTQNRGPVTGPPVWL